MNNIKEKLNSFFLLGDDGHSETQENEDEVTMDKKKEPVNYRKEEHQLKKNGGENIVAINQNQSIKKPRITIVEPRLYSEVHELSDVLLGNQSVIINFRRMDQEQASKMLDFLMGVTYAIKGDIQRLGEEIFICTPQSVDVDGSELSEFTESFLQ